MTYGLMPQQDFATMDKILELVCNTFPGIEINTLEIGVHMGHTSRGIHNFFAGKRRWNNHTGIDNQHDLRIKVPFPGCRLIIGSSIEVYNQVVDNSQHFIFLDGNHSYPYTLTDFLLYSDKVINKGFIAFHDCSPHIKPFQDWQHVGSKSDPDMFISCRKAVKKLGLLDGFLRGWKLIFDEYDPGAPTGGIVLVQRVEYNLGDKAYYLKGDEPVLVEIDEGDLHAIHNGQSNLYLPV